MKQIKKLIYRMSLAIIAFLLVSCSVSNVFPMQNVPAPEIETTRTGSTSVGDWPRFRYDVNRTGYNPEETQLKPPLKLKWRFEARSKI